MQGQGDEAEEAVKLDGDGNYDIANRLPENTLPRLKQGLDIKNLLEGGAATFEVETSEVNDTLGLDDDETNGTNDESVFYLQEYFKNPAQQNEEISKSIGLDEALGQFEELIPTMTSIAADDKVKKLIVRKGNGKLVAPDGKVYFHYIAFADGKDEPFDSSIQRQTVEQILLNSSQCVPGLEIALKSMEVREISKFWIHYDLCYGKLGIMPRIPPAASCVFTVEVLECITLDKLQSVHFMSREERMNLPFDQLYAGAEEMKSTGNASYSAGQYREAIKRYRKGIDYLESYSTLKFEEDKQRTDLLFFLYTNIAQCYLKTESYPRACTASRLALKLPHHPLVYKVYYRFAQAKFALKNFDDALNLCKKSVSFAPSDKNISEITNYLAKIEQKIKEEGKELTAMYKNMWPSSKGKASGSGDNNGAAATK